MNIKITSIKTSPKGNLIVNAEDGWQGIIKKEKVESFSWISPGLEVSVLVGDQKLPDGKTLHWINAIKQIETKPVVDKAVSEESKTTQSKYSPEDIKAFKAKDESIVRQCAMKCAVEMAKALASMPKNSELTNEKYISDFRQSEFSKILADIKGQTDDIVEDDEESQF